MGFFNWPPFVAVALDADTGKPLDPNIGMRVKREFYDVKKTKNGQKVTVAHKSGSAQGSKAGGGGEEKKNGIGDGKKDGNGNGKKGENGKGGGGGGGEEKKNEGGGEKKDPDAPFTAEEDAKLKELKAEGKTWAQIVNEMGRPKKAITVRWNEIKNAGGDAGAEGKKDGGEKKGGKGDKAGAEDNNKKADKQEKKANKKDKTDNKPAEEKRAPSKAGSISGGSGQARFTMNEWMTLQEDDLFSFGELQCLSELMMRDERHRWMRIASAFFDKTGRRIHPEDIREKFVEMGGMGSQK